MLNCKICYNIISYELREIVKFWVQNTQSSRSVINFRPPLPIFTKPYSYISNIMIFNLNLLLNKIFLWLNFSFNLNNSTNNLILPKPRGGNKHGSTEEHII